MSVSREERRAALVRRHQRVGWGALALFAGIGLVLEAFHGLKLGFYLDLANETRRLMFTLAHAHGALLGLVNLAFSASVPVLASADPAPLRGPAACLLASTVLLPAGFLIGGAVTYGGDPGFGIVLVPMGAVLLLAGLVRLWLLSRRL